MFRFFYLLISFFCVLNLSFTPQAYAISYYLPDYTVTDTFPTFTPTNTLPGLIIGRLADRNGISVAETSVKLIYNDVPDSVTIFDGPYCSSSKYDNHTASSNSPCSSTALGGEVYFDFQALNNTTGVTSPNILRVKGSTMAAAGGVNGSYSVNLSGLQDAAPSTDGKYFVKVRVSWALQNAASCTQDSDLSQNCRTGSNSFNFIMPRQTDLVTYASTITDSYPLTILTKSQYVRDTDFSNHLFQFGVPCNATAGQLEQSLKWQDADYGEDNQDGNIAWYLIDDTASGGPKVVATRSNGDLGGQNQVRTYAYKFELNHKYRWYWQHVQNNNGIQAWLPFDSYNYNIDCSAPPTPMNYTISGNVYADTNNNQLKDLESEYNIASTPSISISPNLGTITTNPNGSYTISNLPAGRYVVSYNSLPSGYHMTSPRNGPPPSYQVTVGQGCDTSAAIGASCQ